MFTIEWNVKNAISRDVERQHLNKILADIRTSVKEVYASVPQSIGGSSDVYSVIAGMVSSNTERGLSVTYNPQGKKLDFSVNSFRVRLTGDVEGTGTSTGLSDITINTSLADSNFIREAPLDGNSYWRNQGAWQAVPNIVYTLSYIQGPGFTGTDADNQWYSRTFQSTPSRITITNPDGVAGNPVFDLATVPNSGLGALVGIQRDAYGRVTGTKSVTTDDLTEGTTNIYFTQERAQDAAGLMFTDSVDIDFTYDDANGTVTGVLTPAVKTILTNAIDYTRLKASLIAGSNITITADDTAKTLTIASTASGGGSGTVTSVGLSAPTGFSVTNSPVTTSGNLTLNYSTGYQGYTTTEATKLAGIAPGATANTGTVTSVNASGGSTGLSFSGGPITASGTLTISGTLGLANGGTGATTAAAAVINLGVNLYVEKATAPVTADFGRAPINGDEWWNTTNGSLYKRVDGAWALAGGAAVSPSYKLPTVLTNGTSSNLTLNADRSVPALLTDGTAASIPTVT